MQVSIWEKESFYASQDVIIIGSGFVGLWSAYYLKKKDPDLKVTIIERGQIPTGASTRNAGFACFGSLSEVVHDAQTMGRDTMLELVEMRFRGLERIVRYFGKEAIDFELCGGYELYDRDGKVTSEQLQDNIEYINSLFKPVTGSKKTYRLTDDAIHQFGFGNTWHLVKNNLEGYLHSGKLVQALLKKVPYDAVADFEPITKLGTITLALVANPSVPANDLKELIAYAKTNPGKLTFGAGSSSSRMSGELLKTMAGIDMLYVPYKSNPQAVTDLLGGQISIFFGDVSTALPPVRAGKLKSYAVSGIKRSPLAPDLPTIDEAGLKGYELTAWFAAYAPAKTPKPIIDKLNAAFREALKDKEVSEKLLTAGIEPEASSPDELRKFQAVETEKWKKIVADAKIEPE